MAKPNRGKKYQRGRARARARRPPRRTGSSFWIVAVAAVVVLGVGAVVAQVASNKGANGGGGAGLKIGDHWHAALGVNVCGTWLPNPPETPRDSQGLIVRHGTDVYAGIHTHGDGLIHFEPQTSDDAGASATVGRFFKYNGWSLSETSFTFDKGVKKSNGDTCPAANGKPAAKGTVQWAVNGKARTGNPASYTPHNNDRIVIAFLPPGISITSLGDPPSTSNLPAANNIESPNQIPAGTATVPSSTPAASTPAASTPTTAPATTAKP
ncbi:MAG TPA: hypothetical protein VFC33_06480 [Acidimicrobiia bacterium]|nr:hypothetical protein [Acidimicrobiia bacterium]